MNLKYLFPSFPWWSNDNATESRGNTNTTQQPAQPTCSKFDVWFKTPADADATSQRLTESEREAGEPTHGPTQEPVGGLAREPTHDHSVTPWDPRVLAWVLTTLILGALGLWWFRCRKKRGNSEPRGGTSTENSGNTAVPPALL